MQLDVKGAKKWPFIIEKKPPKIESIKRATT